MKKVGHVKRLLAFDVPMITNMFAGGKIAKERRKQSYVGKKEVSKIMDKSFDKNNEKYSNLFYTYIIT